MEVLVYKFDPTDNSVTLKKTYRASELVTLAGGDPNPKFLKIAKRPLQIFYATDNQLNRIAMPGYTPMFDMGDPDNQLYDYPYSE